MSSQFPAMDQEVTEVGARELKDRLDGGEELTLLDTRRPDDFEQWHIEHPNLETVNVPFTEFIVDDEPVEEVPDGVPAGHVVTCCAKGLSSEYVAEVLVAHGRSVEAMADGMRGWARLYEATELDAGGDATVVQYHRPSSGCLAYLVQSGGEAAVIDPLRAFTDRYVADVRARGATLEYAVDTHVHADHVSGVRDLAESVEPDRIGGGDDGDSNSGTEIVLPQGAEERGLAFDARLVADGDTLEVGDVALEAVHIPGHTTEMTGFRVGDVFVTGDTVFLGSVARPDLEDADAAAEAAATLHETGQAIGDLPDGTVIAPGHVSPGDERAADGTFTARVGDLRDRLAAFGMDREEFVDAVTDDLPPRPNGFREIIPANLGRHDVDDDEAFELELGPNNCAAEG